MWFTFILFYSDLLIFMDIHFTWARWPIQWTVLNSLNIGKPFQNIWQLYKSSTHNFNMSQITTGTAALWVFSCKTARCFEEIAKASTGWFLAKFVASKDAKRIKIQSLDILATFFAETSFCAQILYAGPLIRLVLSCFILMDLVSSGI